MLEGNNFKPAAVQVLGRTHMIIQPIIVDLQADCRRIVVHVSMIGHRNDDGFQISSGGGNCGLQVRGEGCDSAAARERVSDERDTIYDGHVGISGYLSVECPDGTLKGEPREEGSRTPSTSITVWSLSASGFTSGP